MSERRSDRWLSIALSVVTHAAIAAALVWGYWHYKHPAPQPQQLAIEATVVDMTQLPPGTLPSQAPAPAETAPAPVDAPAVETPPEPEPEPAPAPAPEPKPRVEPPKPTPQEVAQKAAQRKAAEQRAKADVELRLKAAADKAAKLKADKEKADRQKADKDKADKERAARDQADKAQAARDEAERKVREQAARDKELAALQHAQREAELRARLAAEEHFAAAQASGQLAQYLAQIRARIERAWIRPASVKAGLSCEVRITQVPGGEVVGVQVGRCNGDESVRQSIEAAAYRASPLPQPADPALFDRNILLTFIPQD